MNHLAISMGTNHITSARFYRFLTLFLPSVNKFTNSVEITFIQGVPKKWYTFENAVIRNGKQVMTLFLYTTKFQLPTTFKCQFMAKICIFVKKWQNIFFSIFFEIDHFRCVLPKN